MDLQTAIKSYDILKKTKKRTALSIELHIHQSNEYIVEILYENCIKGKVTQNYTVSHQYLTIQ